MPEYLYFKPVDKIRQIGRKLLPSFFFHELTAQLKGDEIVVGVTQNYLFKDITEAHYLFSSERKDDLENYGGPIREIYAISEKKINDLVAAKELERF